MKSKNLFLQLSQSLLSNYDQEEAQALAYRLLSHYLAIERKDIILNSDCQDDFDFEPIIKRLLQFEPLQHILGQEEFFGLQFEVNPHVLIPRPETEELVMAVLDDQKSTYNLSILEIGTGSGCIPVSLAKALPQAEVYSMDVSEEALLTAKRNAIRNNVHINFIQQDLFQPFSFDKNFDVVVSNPPYVRELEKKLMDPNVLNFEPELALFVPDDDPLKFYRRIMEVAKANLKKGGKLYVEMNEFLSQEMIALAEQFQFDDIQLKQDFLGKDRFLIVK